MPIARATVTLNKVSGIPADAVQNVWHFDTGAAAWPTAAGDVAGPLIIFYEAIQDYLSPTLDSASLAHSVEIATVTPGAAGPGDDTVTSPQYTADFDLPDVGSLTTALPDEMAAALSFRSTLAGFLEESGSTRPRSRRRGRIYLGPLGVNTKTTAADGNSIVLAAAFRDVVLDAITAACVSWNADDITLSIYSRMNASVSPVVDAWMDDAYDVIRSRGIKATSRDTRTAIQ